MCLKNKQTRKPILIYNWNAFRQSLPYTERKHKKTLHSNKKTPQTMKNAESNNKYNRTSPSLAMEGNGPASP